MTTMNNESRKFLAELQGLENFADRKKLVTEWLYNDEATYDALADFFERLFANDNSDKAHAILTYFRELYGVDDDYISESVEDLPEAPVCVIGAHKVTGDHATVIGQQIVGLSSEFVGELLAAKDRQIETLLALVERLKGSPEK